MPDQHLAVRRYARIAPLLIAFLALFAAFSLRNLEPLTFPTIFAEDGSWFEKIARDGPFAASLTVRPGFPVLGLTLLQSAAILAIDVFFSGDIFYLPAAYFVVSNAFLAGLALFMFCVLRRFLSAAASLGAVIATVLMPVGLDGNEIFGRILNLVFLFPPLTFLLLVDMSRSRRSWAALLPITAVLLVCLMTLPVAHLVVVSWLALALTLQILPRKAITPTTSWMADRPYGWRLIGIVIVCVAIAAVLLPPDVLTDSGGAKAPIAFSAMIEFALARTVLYPFVAAFYDRLSDATTVALTALYAAVCIFALVRQIRLGGLSDKALLLVFAAMCLGCQVVALVIFRPGLTSLFDHYRSTFPDRYFYGANITSVLVLAIALDSLAASRARMLFGGAAALLVACGVIAHAKTIIELSRPATTWRDQGDIVQTTCAFARGALPTNPGANAAPVAIPIYPPAWSIVVSRDRYELFLRRHCAAT